MSSYGSLKHMFEIENPTTLLESLSWNQITPLKSIHHSSSFTEIFGELHFKDTNLTHNNELINQTLSSVSTSITPTTTTTTSHKSSDSFSSLSSESLHLCTEGLGFESSDDVEDLKNGGNNDSDCWQSPDGNKKHLTLEDCCEGECRTRSRVNGLGYPPPISCIGRSGKPWITFMSYRNNGRFVLKQIRVPTQEFLHAHREDGRLTLHFVHPHDDDDDDDDFLQQDDDNIYQEEGEEDYDDVERSGEGEENYESVTDHVNEEK